MPRKKAAPGKLIVFEGPDGVGKSTISCEILNRLKLDGLKCELLTFPGREEGTIGKLVYQIHNEPKNFGIKNVTPTSLQALHIAAHLDVIERRIKPMLKGGTTVLLDRYWWSTWVYGLVGGMNPEVLESMIETERKLWGDIAPALAVLIWRDAPIDRDDPVAYWNKLRRAYDRLADQERQEHAVFVLDNNGTFESSVETIIQAIRNEIPAGSIDRPVQGELGIGSNGTPQQSEASVKVVSHISPIQPTVVYDTFWRFAAERQDIFFKRLEVEPRPWTDDPILSNHKFTNVYRASDRTSQYLIRHVIYRDDLPQTEREIFFRIILFKLFNLNETWELLEQNAGPITLDNYSFERFDKILSTAIESGRKIYSGAYIMPPGNRSFGHSKKHRNHLALLESMLANDLPERIASAKNMQEGFELLLDYPTIGDFLAFQLITDINYSEITDFTEMEFVIPGPGARDGIQKCFNNRGGLNEPELIKFMADHQEREFERLGLSFQSLWGRRLQLIDCQNLFCEVDKYARVRHPDIDGLSGRKRIKRRFSPNPERLAVWYPPKWGLNERIVGTTD